MDGRVPVVAMMLRWISDDPAAIVPPGAVSAAPIAAVR
jgi:hypothetical protein